MNMPTPQDARREIKFVAPEMQMHRVELWLKLHRAGFYSPYPDRRVNNIYFDTPDYGAFAENLSGVSSRTKVRYRWYGEAIEPAAGTLEVKVKRNCFGWKLPFDVPEAPYRPRANWKEVREGIAQQLPDSGAMWLQASPVAILINRYFRRYFVSRDGRIRVTLDTRQGVWDQRFKPHPNFSRSTPLPPSMVVEVKFDKDDFSLASTLVQEMPIRVSRHSKYVSGVAMIAGA